MKDPILVKKQKARDAAKAAREKSYDLYSTQMIDFGHKIERTEEGSKEEADLIKRKNRIEKAFKRSRK